MGSIFTGPDASFNHISSLRMVFLQSVKNLGQCEQAVEVIWLLGENRVLKYYVINPKTILRVTP